MSRPPYRAKDEWVLDSANERYERVLCGCGFTIRANETGMVPHGQLRNECTDRPNRDADAEALHGRACRDAAVRRAGMLNAMAEGS